MQMADDEESPFEPGKILVRDLAPKTTQDYLNRYFTQFGDVTEAIIPHNSVTGSPHSFGFVVFKHPFRVPFILQLPHCIHHHCIEVSRAIKEEDLQTLESQRMNSPCDHFERLSSSDRRKIVVRGPPNVRITNDEFLKFFQGFGNVILCQLWNDIGEGHITFRIKRGADRVLYQGSCIINGTRFRVYGMKPFPQLQDHNDAHSSNVQEEAEESSGADHVNGTKDMQPQEAAASVGNSTRNAQMVPAAADFIPRNMQSIPPGPDSGEGYRPIIPAGASSGTAGHPWNNSFHTNFPPSDQRILHYRLQMNYMVPGVPVLHYRGLRPALYQARDGMGIPINAANNFPGRVVAIFPPNYAGHGNFPMTFTDHADQDFNHNGNSNG